MNGTAKKPIPTNAADLAHSIRQRALATLGRLSKCSAAKAEECMQRPAAKYDGYRVAFANIVDAGITDLFARIDSGALPITIKAAHWSAVEGTEAQRAFLAITHGPASFSGCGSLVSYWMPNSDSNTGATA